MHKPTFLIYKLIFVFFIFMGFANCSNKPSTQEVKAWEEYSKFAYITVKNESGFPLNSIMFFPYDKIARKINLKNGNDTLINLSCSGESYYLITAILSNGDSLKTHGNYFEGGYQLTEIIKSDSIITKY